MSFRSKAISSIFYSVSQLLYKTLKVNQIGNEKIEQCREQYGGVIVATWHGRSLVPIISYSKRGYWVIVSTSRDGEYQNELLSMYGFKTVRGSSSSRGAVTSALKMAKTLNQGRVLAITPDGPRGPLHVVQPGAIFIAEKSGCPILPFGVSAYPRKLVSTWDKYMIPTIGSQTMMIYGDPMFIPPKLDDEQRQSYSVELGNRITALETEAELMVRTKIQKSSSPAY